MIFLQRQTLWTGTRHVVARVGWGCLQGHLGGAVGERQECSWNCSMFWWSGVALQWCRYLSMSQKWPHQRLHFTSSMYVTDVLYCFPLLSSPSPVLPDVFQCFSVSCLALPSIHFFPWSFPNPRKGCSFTAFCSDRLVILLSSLPASSAYKLMTGQLPQKLPCSWESCLKLCLEVALMPSMGPPHGYSCVLSSWTESPAHTDWGKTTASSLIPLFLNPPPTFDKRKAGTESTLSTVDDISHLLPPIHVERHGLGSGHHHSALALIPAPDSNQPLIHLNEMDQVPSVCQCSALNFKRLLTYTRARRCSWEQLLKYVEVREKKIITYIYLLYISVETEYTKMNSLRCPQGNR